jgi:predicted RecB family nuclease
MRLDKVLRLRGAVESDPRDAAAAARRCAQCPFTPLCDEALAAGKDVRLFCPNTHYVEALRSGSLKFG